MSVSALNDYCEAVLRVGDDKAKWLEARRAGIGASDMPALFGLDSNRGPLWLWGVKVGEILPDDLDGVEAVEWGLRLERPVLQAFGDRIGQPTEASGVLYRSRRHPWAQATLDGWVVPADAPPWPVEVKTTAAYKEADWEVGVPQRHVVQVHHQMLVTGATRVSVACLIGGQRLVWAHVDRDESLVHEIVARGTEFWGQVEARKMPSIYGPGASSLIKQLWPREEPGTPLALGPEFEAIAAKRWAAKERRDAAARIYDECSDQIRIAMGSRAEAVLPNGDRFTWKTKNMPPRAATSYRELRFYPRPEGKR